MRTSSSALLFFLAANAFGSADAYQFQIPTSATFVRQLDSANTLRQLSSAILKNDLHPNKGRNTKSLQRNMVPEAATLWSAGTGDAVLSQLPTITLADHVIAGLAQSRPSPNVEVEVLNNMSHVALDLFGLLNPERFLLRISALAGRVMLMAADYDADQYISTDEWLFQGGMLALSLKQVLHSWHQMKPAGFLRSHPYAANDDSSSFRDRVVYQVFFSPLGLSWLQYRTLVGSCIDWVDVQPNQSVSTLNEDGDHVAYWLYNGKVSVKHGSSKGEHEMMMHHRRGKPITMKICSMQNGQDDEAEKRKKETVKDFGLITGPGIMSALVDEIDVSTMDGQERTDSRGDTLDLTAGQEGATMMQINVAKLRKLMEDDETLDKVVRNLILMSMRNRMKSMMIKTSDNRIVAV